MSKCQKRPIEDEEASEEAAYQVSRRRRANDITASREFGGNLNIKLKTPTGG
jgi:hypothetical protein